jgi:AraC family transcriptional regulator
LRHATIVPVFARPYARFAHYHCAGPCCRAAREEAATAVTIAFPTEGVFVKRDRNGEAVADNTHAVFFNPGQPFEVDHPSSAPDHCWFLTLAGEDFAYAWMAFGGGERFRRGRAFTVPAAPLAPKTWLALADFVRTLADKASDDLARREMIFNVLDAVLPAGLGDSGRVVERQAGESHRVRIARLEINAGFRERVTLEALAERAGLSPFHLCRRFKQETGLTIHQTLSRLRLRQSLEDLKDAARSITEVALGLGFASHSHFTAAFSKTFGLSPTAFRQRLA